MCLGLRAEPLHGNKQAFIKQFKMSSGRGLHVKFSWICPMFLQYLSTIWRLLSPSEKRLNEKNFHFFSSRCSISTRSPIIDKSYMNETEKNNQNMLDCWITGIQILGVWICAQFVSPQVPYLFKDNYIQESDRSIYNVFTCLQRAICPFKCQFSYRLV